jgi:predicted nucleotide-binding protein
MLSKEEMIYQLIKEINLLIEQTDNSIIPIVTKAIRLASLCEEEEYRLLFELHLNGITADELEEPRIQKWSDYEKKPKWNLITALFQDRAMQDKKFQSLPLSQLELMRERLKEEYERFISNRLYDAAKQLIAAVVEAETILDKIRNRVGQFIRVTEKQFFESQIKMNQMSQTEINTPHKIIFIGHGRSAVWKDLKDFIADRLNLTWDEFNREPAAGKTTIERLEEMLNKACFAFLVMTGEDEHSDQRLHARENVIHEIGLFQGKLGFQKAIILLEDGCQEFSNIHGLTQIRFPKGNISVISEQLRQVLERENILA